MSTISAYDIANPGRARYRYKAGKGKASAQRVLDSATDSVKGTYGTVKTKLEDTLS